MHHLTRLNIHFCTSDDPIGPFNNKISKSRQLALNLFAVYFPMIRKENGFSLKEPDFLESQWRNNLLMSLSLLTVHLLEQADGDSTMRN